MQSDGISCRLQVQSNSSHAAAEIRQSDDTAAGDNGVGQVKDEDEVTDANPRETRDEI